MAKLNKDFNGWSFDDPAARRRMKYLVVMAGDLDLNNAYAFTNKRDLDEYLSEQSGRETYAVFSVTDLTPSTLSR